MELFDFINFNDQVDAHSIELNSIDDVVNITNVDVELIEMFVGTNYSTKRFKFKKFKYELGEDVYNSLRSYKLIKNIKKIISVIYFKPINDQFVTTEMTFIDDKNKKRHVIFVNEMFVPGYLQFKNIEDIKNVLVKMINEYYDTCIKKEMKNYKSIII